MVYRVNCICICSPFCCKRYITCRSPSSAVIFRITVKPTCIVIACASWRRQRISRVKRYCLRIDIHTTAVCIERNRIIVRLPICGIISIAVTTRGNDNSHRLVGKVSPRPTDKGIARASRRDKRNISAFYRIVKRISRTVRSIIQRIRNIIGNCNGRSRYNVSV